MFKSTLKNVGLAILLMVLASTHTASARQAISWNLSRDLLLNGMATNPKGVWAFMENVTGNTNPAKYTLLPTYSSPCDWSFWNATAPSGFVCWEDLKMHGVIGFGLDGFLEMHPPSEGKINNQVVLRWTSPVAGNISVSGRISLVNSTCGDGVNWYFRTQSTVLQSGVIAKGLGATFPVQILPMTKAAKLYFVVDSKANNYCDSVYLDMLITHLSPK